MSTYLTADQIGQLLRPINPRRVLHRDGMSHVEAYDVRAHLDRIFGFARWSADVLDCELLFETIGPKSDADKRIVVSVGYRARLRLTIRSADGTELATYTEVATGDATNFPMVKRADAHDFAVKTAESQALKRAATNLGDQFGLSLYHQGSTDALVGRTLITEDVAAPVGIDDASPDVVAERDEQPADESPAAEPAAQGPAPATARRQTRTADVSTLKVRIAQAMPGKTPADLQRIVSDSVGKPYPELTAGDLQGFLDSLTTVAV